MISDPQSFFRFAAQYYSLLSDLYRHDEGLSDRDLLELIARNADPESPSCEHIMDRLDKLRIIEPVPGETARWEMTHPVRSLFRFLLHEQRLTSVAVIQGYLNDLGSCRDALEEGIGAGERTRVVRSLREMSEAVDRLRRDVSDNHMAILNISMKTKANREHVSAFDRYGTINHVWVKYMDPMRDIIDVRKSMEALLDGLDRLLYSGVIRFARHPEVVRELSGCRARLLRMRRNVAADFHESLREIEPLYESLKAESEMARGAAVVLGRIEKEGLAALDLDRMMGIPVWRTEGLLSDTALAVCMRELLGHEPGETPVVTGIEVSLPDEYADPAVVLGTLREALPVEDLLAWLSERCPGSGLTDILRLYGTVYCSSPWRVDFGADRREYHIRGARIDALPMTVLEEEVG